MTAAWDPKARLRPNLSPKDLFHITQSTSEYAPFVQVPLSSRLVSSITTYHTARPDLFGGSLQTERIRTKKV
ncbi:hypothetical protein E6O75_ATG01952 [Venturia nashicola]|uniref:Uncharacterized protein n=1 Tax=Venturia nashicola TaxID=86259 RepID=A0A4Z1P552_9PEZI|nr:hypothetical protein E6O75_ATG01952 [Venturia nashicola]